MRPFCGVVSKAEWRWKSDVGLAAARLTPAQCQTEGIRQASWRPYVTGDPPGRKTPAAHKEKQIKCEVRHGKKKILNSYFALILNDLFS